MQLGGQLRPEGAHRVRRVGHGRSREERDQRREQDDSRVAHSVGAVSLAEASGAVDKVGPVRHHRSKNDLQVIGVRLPVCVRCHDETGAVVASDPVAESQSRALAPIDRSDAGVVTRAREPRPRCHRRHRRRPRSTRQAARRSPSAYPRPPLRCCRARCTPRSRSRSGRSPPGLARQGGHRGRHGRSTRRPADCGAGRGRSH